MADIETITTVVVKGMTCKHCVRSVTEELTKLDGVAAVHVDLDADRGSGRVTLHTTAPVAPDALRAAVEAAGYEVSP